jgi:alkylmercury lyase
MKPDVSAALKRLDAILPLLSGLKSLNGDNVALYCKLLNSYVERGRTLSRDEVAGLIDNPDEALKNIADHKLIVLDADGNPCGAYPFTSETREHKVRVNGVTVHCMCALDALSVSPMFARPTVVDSRCHVTGKPIHLEQNGTHFSSGALDAWFGINWGAATTDTVCAESLCLEMMFLADAPVARQWLAESPDSRETFDLPSAVAFAAGFFVPLAESCRQATFTSSDRA